jgi:hypothetical protein
MDRRHARSVLRGLNGRDVCDEGEVRRAAGAGRSIAKSPSLEVIETKGVNCVAGCQGRNSQLAGCRGVSEESSEPIDRPVDLGSDFRPTVRNM